MSALDDAPQAQQSPPRPAPWLDLVLYLVLGFGLFFPLGYALRGVLRQDSLLRTAILFLLNILVFNGVVLGVGVLRGRLSLAEIGFWPPRLPWNWISLAVVITIILLPFRAVLGLLIQLVLHGSLQGLVNAQRMQLLTPSGPLLPNFLVSIVLGGILIPISEELFFRGALFTWFRRRYALWVAVLASALLFGLAHFDTAAVVGASFVIGLLNAYLFERTRSIWVPITVHVVNNSLGFLLLYGILVVQKLLRF